MIYSVLIGALIVAAFVFKWPSSIFPTTKSTDAPPDEPTDTEVPITSTEVPFVESAPVFIGVNLLKVDIVKRNQGTPFAYYHAEVPMISEKGLDELSAFVGFSSSMQQQKTYEEFCNMFSNDQQPTLSEPDYGHSINYDSRAYVRRADDVVLSVLYVTSECRNNRISTYLSSFNASTADLIELNIRDIISDFSLFTERINDKLASISSKLSISKEDCSSLIWTLDHDGVTIFFSDQEGKFADIAKVCNCITLRYNENSDIIYNKWITEGSIYSAAIPFDIPYFTEIDGEITSIIVGQEAEVDSSGAYFTNKIIISLDGKEFSYKPYYGIVEDDGPVLITGAIIMHTEYGDYLYIESICGERGNAPMLFIFSISELGVECTGKTTLYFSEHVIENSNSEDETAVFESFPTDPRAFAFGDRIYIPIDMNIWRTCKIGRNGWPISIDEIYYAADECLLRVDVPLSANKLDEEGNSSSEVLELTVAGAVRLISTDLENYFDVEVYDGEETVYARIQVYVEDNLDYYVGIERVPFEDAFTLVTDDVALG